MDELGPASEHDMVLAFLKAEIDSPTYRECYETALRRRGLARAIIETPLTDDVGQNRQRAAILGDVRGYPDRALFQGFPRDVTWRRVRIEPVEMRLIKYGSRMEGWIGLARSRSVVEAGASVWTLSNKTSARVKGVVDRIRSGATFPPLIAADGDGGDLILLEGYTRATGYAAAQIADPIEVLVGRSPTMYQWHWY